MMLQAFMLRGGEERRITLAHLSTAVCHATWPQPADLFCVSVHGAKTNKDGKKLDNRYAAPTDNMLVDAQYHLAVHMYKRFAKEPWPLTVIDNYAWCVVTSG